MSVNAKNAYSAGEMPISKWTKKVMLETIFSYAENEEIEIPDVKKLTAPELRNAFLTRIAWHHTGALYNKTNFYTISEDKILSFTIDDLNDIINKRKSVIKKDNKEDAERNRKTLGLAIDIYKKLNIIFASKILSLKTMSGLVKKYTTNKLDLDSAYSKAIECLKAKDKMAVDGWRRLPADHWRQECVDLYDTSIDEYMVKRYVQDFSSNCKDIQLIKQFIK